MAGHIKPILSVVAHKPGAQAHTAGQHAKEAAIAEPLSSKYADPRSKPSLLITTTDIFNIYFSFVCLSVLVLLLS